MAQSRSNYNLSNSPFIDQFGVVVSTSPGEIQLRTSVTSKSSEELFAGPIGGLFPDELRATYDIDVDVRPRKLYRVTNRLETELEVVANDQGIEARVLSQRIQNKRSDFNISAYDTTITVPPGETTSDVKTISFTPITVFLPSGVSIVDAIDESNYPEFSITTNTPGIIRGGTKQETVTVKIPVDAFIEERTIEFDCSTLHSDIVSDIDALRTDVNTLEQGLNSAASSIQSNAEQLLSIAQESTSGGLDTLAGRIEQLEQTDVATRTGTSVLQQIRTEVESTQDYQRRAEELQNTQSSIQSDVETDVSSNCASEIQGQLDSASSGLGQTEEKASDLEELKEATLNILSNIESVDCSSKAPSIDDRLTGIEQQLGTADFSQTLSSPYDTSVLNDIESTLDTISSDIASQFSSNDACSSVFQSRREAAQSKLERIQQGIDEPDEPELPGTPEPPDILNCSDISKSIRSSVASIEGAVSGFQNRDQLARTSERKEELLAEVKEVRQRVQDEVTSDNPCKQELLSRLDQALSGLQTASLRPETALPCTERFNDVGKNIEEFEDNILAIEPPVTPTQVQNIARRGNEIIASIESDVPADDPCRAEMSERVNSLVQRVENLSTQVRISTDEAVNVGGERQNRINELLERISNINLGGTDEGSVSEDIEDIT